MSYRMQPRHLSQSHAEEDARHSSTADTALVNKAIARYHRTGRMPHLPSRLIGRFTEWVAARLARECRVMDQRYAAARDGRGSRA